MCGAANNQLATPDVEYTMGDHSIVWVPDYVANSGGLIQVASEIDQLSREQTVARVDQIGDLVTLVLSRAALSGEPAGRAALDIARQRLAGSAQ